MMSKILIVDDDPDFVEVTRTVLLAHGYEVSSASSGERALAAMRQEVPDLVLLDVIMTTALEGVSVCRRMRHDPALANVPVIMISSISSSSSGGVFGDDKSCPIDGWFTKPVAPDELIAKVESVLVAN
jgi:DNA-binding response OmpR family regulator